MTVKEDVESILKSYRENELTLTDSSDKICSMVERLYKKAYDIGQQEFLEKWLKSDDPLSRIALAAKSELDKCKTEASKDGYLDALCEDSGTFCFGSED